MTVIVHERSPAERADLWIGIPMGSKISPPVPAIGHETRDGVTGWLLGHDHWYLDEHGWDFVFVSLDRTVIYPRRPEAELALQVWAKTGNLDLVVPPCFT